MVKTKPHAQPVDITADAGGLVSHAGASLLSELADRVGATRAFTTDCRSAQIRFSVGYELTETVREAMLSLPESASVEAIDAEGSEREGASVAELSDHVHLDPWPEATRLICRRDRPHPGAQFEVFDAEGFRHTAFLADQEGEEIAVLELRQRRRARVEDSMRAAKDTGMRNLPYHRFASACFTPPDGSSARVGGRRCGCRAAG